MEQPFPVAGPLADLMGRAALGAVARLIGFAETRIAVLADVLSAIRANRAYRSVKIPKRRGGYRTLDIPVDPLKEIQRRIHQVLLAPRYVPTPVCHSFVRWGNEAAPRTIVSNAFAHLGVPPGIPPNRENLEIQWRVPRSLLAVDLKDAYPAVTEERVFAIYREVAGDPWTAAVLTALSVWNGCLPQGAPTSPLLFNFACLELDRALDEVFGHPPFVVTRYADDITITSVESEIPFGAERILTDLALRHGFRLNHEKTLFLRSSSHILRVTGINLKPEERRLALPPAVVDRFRSLTYHAICTLRWVWNTELAGGKELQRTAFAKTLRIVEQRALGYLGATFGFAGQVYGKDALPARLSSWAPGALREALGSARETSAHFFPDDGYLVT